MRRPMSARSVEQLDNSWNRNSHWARITRPYAAAEVVRLRGSVHIEHTLAELGAHRLWSLLHQERPVAALGALTGNQAVQAVKAGLFCRQSIWAVGKWPPMPTLRGRCIRIKASIRSTAYPTGLPSSPTEKGQFETLA